RPVSSSWPGLYELLPSVNGVWAQTDPNAVKLYSKATYQDENDHVSQARLDAALLTRVAIDATLTGPRPQEVSVTADGTPTNYRLKRSSMVSENSAYQQGDGDGAVPAERSVLPGVPNVLTLIGAPHQNIMSQAGFLAAVNTLVLEGSDTTPVTVP